MTPQNIAAFLLGVFFSGLWVVLDRLLEEMSSRANRNHVMAEYRAMKEEEKQKEPYRVTDWIAQ